MDPDPKRRKRRAALGRQRALSPSERVRLSMAISDFYARVREAALRARARH